MIFESALRSELIAIEELKNKVYPVAAPKDAIGPFVTYKEMEVDFEQTLQGNFNKVEGYYMLTVISKDYSQVQDIKEKIKNKLLTFHGRAIGDNGPLIKKVSVKFKGTGYFEATEEYGGNIELRVNY